MTVLTNSLRKRGDRVHARAMDRALVRISGYPRTRSAVGTTLVSSGLSLCRRERALVFVGRAWACGGPPRGIHREVSLSVG